MPDKYLNLYLFCINIFVFVTTKNKSQEVLPSISHCFSITKANIAYF